MKTQQTRDIKISSNFLGMVYVSALFLSAVNKLEN